MGLSTRSSMAMNHVSTSKYMTWKRHSMPCGWKITLNDIYDNVTSENRNDKISLLYESKKTNYVAVKTAMGLTPRNNLPGIVQQGGTWGSLLCSNSIDTIGKKCRDRNEHFYLYKKSVKIYPLGFVDDLCGISLCGFKSLELNCFLTAQVELKKLRFHTTNNKGESKCHKLHVGKMCVLCTWSSNARCFGRQIFG